MLRIARVIAAVAVITVCLPAQAALGGLGSLVGGGGFEADYYPECHAPIAAAREHVEPPPEDYGAKAEAAAGIANAASRLGVVPGLGGLGSLGQAANAAQTAATVARYGSWIVSAAEYAQQMRDDHPELDGRIGAYGDAIALDADQLDAAGRAAIEAQECYVLAYDSLRTQIEAGEVRRRERSRRFDEITDGLDEVSTLLIDARNRMNGNIRAYNDGLESDVRDSSVDLGGLLGAAISTGLAEQALRSIENESSDYCTGARASWDANCARIAAARRAQAAGGWGGLYTDADPAGTEGPSYGVAEELAVHGALASGNAGAAIGIIGAASAGGEMMSNYEVLTSDNREAPECAGIDEGAELYACLLGPDAVSGDGSSGAGSYLLGDLAQLGLVNAAPGGASLAAGHLAQQIKSQEAQAQDTGAAVDEKVLAKLIETGEISGRYLQVNRVLNVADRGQSGALKHVHERPW